MKCKYSYTTIANKFALFGTNDICDMVRCSVAYVVIQKQGPFGHTVKCNPH